MGYRQLSEFIDIKYSLTVSKEQVRKCLKVNDPEGVKERWRKVIRRRIYETDGPGDAHIAAQNKMFIRIKRTRFYTHIIPQNKFQTQKFVETVKY